MTVLNLHRYKSSLVWEKPPFGFPKIELKLY